MPTSPILQGLARGGAVCAVALLAGLAVWLALPERTLSSRTIVDLPAGLLRDRRSFAISVRSWDLPIPREPMGVAVLPGGDIVVADVGLAQVHRFTPSGQLVRTFGLDGELRYPTGIASGNGSLVWVADLWQRQVLVLDLDTGRMTPLPASLSGYQQPAALAWRAGLLYVADVGRHQVLVLDESGTLVRVVGTGRGTGPGQLAFPNGVLVSEAGDVYVSDSNNRRIQVFNHEGRLRTILQPHQLSLPRGLAQDAQGRLYVADTLAHDIAVLSPDGQILTRLNPDEALAAPNGVAVHGRRLYVADRLNARVLLLELDDA